ncbi:MAG: LytTR family transcriptional regulator DNA-binding domain-containing protein [Saprospiraceae bacterium]|nr:LytTR family transcriptional regulator DNA-binding domain-containing protein [Saprospiraceae bacterium]
MSSAQIINISSSDDIQKNEMEQLRQELKRIKSQLQALMNQLQTFNNIMVYHSGEYKKITVNEIIMIHSNNNYSTFYLDDGSKILTSKTLKYWETTINNKDLVRIHHSRLINKNKIHVIKVESSEIKLFGNVTARYSRMSKSKLSELLRN